MRTVRWTLALGVLFGCTVISGCGGGSKYYPVEGVVTVDNEPLEGAMIHFTSEANGVAASAMTNANGKFKMITNGNEGVPGGTYKVMVRKAAPQKESGSYGTDPQAQKEAYMNHVKAVAESRAKGKKGESIEKSAIPERYLKPGAIPDQVVPVSGPISIELSSKEKKK